MDQQFPPTLIPNVRVGGRYTVFGRIEDSGSSQPVLNDGSGVIKVCGGPSPLRGFVEVRGVCNSVGTIEALSCLSFAEEVDLAEYVRAVKAIEAFGGRYEDMVTAAPR